MLQNAGPQRGYAMPEAGYLPIPPKLARAGVKDMVRISDARMSGTAFGTIVLHVPRMPRRRAARAGPDGRPDRAVRPETARGPAVAGRTGGAAATGPVASVAPARGYARLYAEQILQADEGCDFGFLQHPGLAEGR